MFNMRTIHPKPTLDGQAISMNSSPSKKADGRRPVCNICRDRKTKCDRAEPKCGRCTRLKQACGYEATPGRGTLPRQILQLQARLARAEARLALSHLDDSTVRALQPNTFFAEAPLDLPAANLDLVTSGSTSNLDQSGIDMSPDASLTSHQGSSSSHGQGLGPSTTTEQYVQNGLATANDVTPDFNFDNLDTIDTFSSTLYAINMDTDWPNLSPMFSPFASLPSRHDAEEPNSAEYGTAAPIDDLTPATLALLRQKFFDDVSSAMPIINRQRFETELLTVSDSRSLSALSNGIALLGALASPEFHQGRDSCYRAARDQLELCERCDDGEEMASLNAFQALLLIMRYEILGKRLTRASLTLGRAIQLARILGLQNVDGRPAVAPVPGLQIGLATSDDEAQLEERRRSFWYLFTLESYITNRSGLPSQLGFVNTFTVNLPSPGELTPGFLPTQNLATRAVLSQGPRRMSSFACSILMVGMAVRCFAHHAGRSHEFDNKGFWDRHYEMVKSMDDCLSILGPQTTAAAVCEDPLSFSTHLNLHAVDIFLHDTAVHEVRKHKLPSEMAAASEKRCSEAAVKIASTIRLVKGAQTPKKDMLKVQAVCLAWPIVMAVRALGRDLSSGGVETPNQAAENMRLLLETLECVEGPQQFWEAYASEMSSMLQKWNEAQSGLRPAADVNT